MSNFLVFLLGCFIGVIIGFFITALLSANKEKRKNENEEY